jgi:hypothetical protein
MKTGLIIISLIFVIVTALVSFVNKKSDDPKNNDHNNPLQIVAADSNRAKKMDANNISTYFRSNGGFNRNPNTDNSGFEWPKGSNKFVRYASGLWIGAIVGNDTLVSIAEYSYEYLPGYIDNNGNPQGKDDPAYRIYKINKGDSVSSDYSNWPVNQGAYTDSKGKPYQMGNQTMFYSSTDGYPEAHGNRAGHTLPLKADILQTNWCYNQYYNILDDVIFMEFRIINKSNIPWTRCFFGIWTDDDLGSATNDAVGSDSILSLGFTFNSSNSDGIYGAAPPAVGFLLLKGPSVPSFGDTAIYHNPPGSNNLILKPNHKNLRFSTITLVNEIPGYVDPANYHETYNLLQGIGSSGNSWINPLTGQVTKFTFSGDPETQTGWVMTTGDDRRSFASTGPVNVNPGDTQTIVIAQIMARGTSNTNSVTKLKQTSRSVQRFFDNNMNVDVNPPSPVLSTYAPGNGKVYLSWNDTCEKVSFKNLMSGGDYKFQGYNVYQIRPNTTFPTTNDTILIKTFDKTDGIQNILDSVYLSSYQGIVYGIVQRGSDNGISRYIVIDKDTLTGNPFIKGSEYKFAVSAYYYDATGGLQTMPKVNWTMVSSNLIKVIPQNLTPETNISYSFGDTIITDQKDLGVMPIVFDPLKLISASYNSTFGLTDSVLSYTLTRTSGNKTTTLLQNDKDFSGNPDTAKVIDGFLMVHQQISDSGIVPDPNTYNPNYFGGNDPDSKSLQNSWSYEPAENLWFEGPDTTAVKTAKVIANRQFQSRSIGMSFPTLGTFKSNKSKIFANGKFFKHDVAVSPILSGGPLRKIQIVFGQSSMSYRFIPADTILANTPYADMVSVPYSVFAVDELDSGGGAPRQLNTGFLDNDNNGLWDPDTSALGKYHFTYIFASDYNPVPDINYTGRNPGTNSTSIGFPSLDVMYVWMPRAKKSPNGIPLNFTNGDKLTVTPFRITRAEFVPGYPLKYNWTVQGTSVNTSSVTANNINNIKAFPNPYYGYSSLEYDTGGERFLYFSNLPLQCNIYIYSLDGSLVNTIVRNVNDPGDSLEKWNLKNSGGRDVASGMYIALVDCKNLGAKTLKIAVFNAK